MVAMAMFAMLGTAVVSLLAQGLNLFSEGTASTSMQDRLQAVLPAIRADVSAIQPVEASGVPPPVAPPDETGAPAPAGPAAPTVAAEPPACRLRSGWVKLTDLPSEVAPVYYAAFVRTHARESEDPQLRDAGSASAATAGEMRAYEPATVDGGAVGGPLLAPGGLLEVVWVAVPEDPDLPGILTLYRLFRAPAGGPKSIVDPRAFDSLGKIRVLGRVVQRGVLDFRITWRNVFAQSWADGAVRAGRVQDGEPYVGEVWDSTRALDDKCPLYRSKDSVGDVRDDVSPCRARIEMTLVTPGPFGFGRGDTITAETVAGSDEKNVVLDDVRPLLRAGPADRWLKVGGEWMSTSIDAVNPETRRAVVRRGQRGTTAREHASGTPVYVGVEVGTDVPLVYKDKYVRRR
jgi:hypothetical protein